MGQTSKKLYNVKNNVLNRNISKIDVKDNDELLFLEAPSQYDEVFRTLGVNSKQDFVKAQMSDSIELGVYQKKYNAEAFKGSHIKKLCNSYDLMIRPISDVKGYLSDDTMKAIVDFTDEFKNTLLSDSSLYILAGRECFYSKFRGKEVKTFIIFYKDGSNHSTSSSRKVHETSVVNQVFSSGNDFNGLRVFNQLFLTDRYQGGDGMPRLAGNLLISIILLIAMLGAFAGKMILGTVILIIYLGLMWSYNTVKAYKDCWNVFSERHYR